MAKFHPHLKRPYHIKGLDPDKHMSRLSADIFVSDKKLIKLISPCMGLLQQMTQLFFASVANELRERNITYYTPENESRLINIIRRRTATLANRQTLARDVRGRVEATHSEAQRVIKLLDYN